MSIHDYNRIIIVGNSASGKSFLANAISSLTDLPIVHLDVEFWRPNWEKPSKDEWIEIQKKLIVEQKWIIEGNYTSTLGMRIETSDVVIFLDISRLLCIYSLFTRHGKTRSDLPSYLEEKFSMEFLQHCRMIWNFNNNQKRRIMNLLEKYPDKQLIIIKSRRKMKNLLKQWTHDSDN